MAIDKAIGIVIAGIGHGDGGRRKGPHPGLDSDPDHSSSSSSPPPSSSATVGAARAGSRVKMLHTSCVCVSANKIWPTPTTLAIPGESACPLPVGSTDLNSKPMGHPQ